MITYTPDVCSVEPGNYYVSIMDGPKWGLVAGPYPTHKQALEVVDRARDIASDLDRRYWFAAWGTVRMDDNYTRPGKINHLL